jgi:hypothetical protein
VDDVSVSLNASNCQRYVELCNPDLNSFPRSDGESASPGLLWDSMIDFLARSPRYFRRTQASVVGYALTGEEINRCRALAHSLGVMQFSVR